jgi:molybdenum cofactor synthesis domain-containing protein
MSPETPPDSTAAILLIGNELLSGKVDDENARFLIRELRALGVSLRRIEVVPDLPDEISDSVRALASRFDLLFTSGGVGPTHDDVTLQAVAAAFSMDIVRHPDLEALLRRGYGDRLHERDLRMADVPSGARLEYGRAGAASAGSGPVSVWPVIVVRNVWVLPGVPSIFRRKFENVRELFRTAPLHGRALYSAAGEGSIAGALDEAVAAFPGVDIGSYPHLDAPDYRVKVTLDGRDATRVDEALAWLAARLGNAVVRTD